MIGTMEDFDEDVEFIATKMNISVLFDHKGAYDFCNGGTPVPKWHGLWLSVVRMPNATSN